MEIWNGNAFVERGEHPVMMFAIDGTGADSDRVGRPFIPYSSGKWQPSGSIRAADSYKSNLWYDVRLEREGNVYTVEVSGDFQYGGKTTYRASIDAMSSCVWHFNRTADEDASKCEAPGWSPGDTWPDYFMFGDPHENYYEGEVYCDDVRLEVRD